MGDNTNDDFDDLLEKIADEIYGNEDVQKLGKKLGFNSANIARFNEENARQGGSHMGTLNMLRKWRQRQKVTEEKKNLKAALENSDFAHFINEYLSTDDVASTVQGASSLYQERKEGHKEVKPDGKGYYNQLMKPANPSKEQLDQKKNYKMDVLPKGHMFISNIIKDRKGSDVDVKNIEHVFKEIGFKIEPHSDLTAEKLGDELETFVNSPCHEGMCCAVFLLMGHGTKTDIRCTDGMVSTKKIMEQISGMKSMNGKPKIVFFQCCRGDAHVKKVETDQAEPDIVIPAKSDVFMVHATTDGNVSYRDTEDGTWFIQMLSEELLENAHVSDLSTMLEQVTGKVGKMAFEENGQCVEVVKRGISKKIYFLPKYHSKE